MRLNCLLAAILVVVMVSGCKSTPDKDAEEMVAMVDPANAVAIDALIPYAKGNKIASNIKRECHLPQKLADFVVTYSNKYNQGVVKKPSVSSEDVGKVLKINIVDAVSSRTGFGAFTGGGNHNKFTEIDGKLYEDGKLIGTFVAKRSSGGGAFGGFKGSCAVLGRTVKALGKDVAKWLRRPEMDSYLGER